MEDYYSKPPIVLYRATVCDTPGAMELWNAPYEGLLATTVLFRDNSVCQVTAAPKAAPIWTSTFSRHSDIMIIRNRFDSGPGAVFLLADVEQVSIQDNDISYCEGDQLVETSNAQAVVMGNNTKKGSSEARLCSATEK
jgi:hypothetical protein